MRMSRLFLCTALFAVACPPPIPEDTDVGTDTDTDSDTEQGTEVVVPMLVQDNEFLEVASRVTLDAVRNTQEDFVVAIRSDIDGASFGEVRGSVALDAGDYANVDVDIDPPASGSETVWMVMYADTNTNGVYDEGVDTPVMVDGEPLQATFQAIVQPGTPQVRIRFEQNGGFVVTHFIPAQRYEDTLGAGTTDQTVNPEIRLRRGVRYEFVNASDAELQFVESGATPQDDIVRLAEGATVGENEDEAGIDWEDDGGIMVFTATIGFLSNVDAYRDGTAPDVRGDVTPQAAR